MVGAPFGVLSTTTRQKGMKNMAFDRKITAYNVEPEEDGRGSTRPADHSAHAHR
ncbi:hypothetical protein SEA_REINDEER_145 [Mycobacterium phage Reindeer]|uniref:Uncharacterized protein n=1 Tax=Mycobacterium phage Reindeer TaxID=2762283 RepID=A0A7G8LI64_9CAUD|nr:hypothetical protein J4U05_gp107 [Mycobacterium phage Reindeer]QNJ56936.1 hypothetical protein SEA_REINDEER_145 [Mycobacterium phage Reindeer]